MKLRCLLVGHAWSTFISADDFIDVLDKDYVYTECNHCGQGYGATALICADCDGEGWVLSEDICDDECCISPGDDFPAYLCPNCDGYGVE